MSDDPLQPALCAELLGALAAPERLRIVRYLRDGPKNVTEIAEMLNAPAVNVSHHLNVLRHAGLVRNQKNGRFVVYSLTPGVQGQGERFQLGCCSIDLPSEPDNSGASSPGD